MLIWGIIFYLGSIYSLEGSLIVIIPFWILLSSLNSRYIAIGVVIFFIPIFLKPLPIIEGVKENCLFKIHSIHNIKNFYSKGFILKGEIFENKQSSQCLIFTKENPKNIDPCYYYKLSGTLIKKGSNFLFKPKGNWEKNKKTFSLAKERFFAKETIKNRLFHKIKDKKAASFLTGITTGELSNQEVRFDLGRLGLQHILAISGFHFAILSSLFFLPLKLIFKPKTATLFLIFILTTYYLFIGTSPSVTRAWISTILFLIGLILEKESSALNRLGTAAVVLLLFDIESSKNLSFILSFSATLGILLFYNPLITIIETFFKKISFQDALKFHFIDQIGMILFSYLKKAIALSIAVNIIVIPLILFYFHNLNILSFLYNLFIPFLIIPSMAMTVIALIIDLIVPSLTTPLYFFINGYTSLILKTTSEIPTCFHINYLNSGIENTTICLYLTAIIILGLIWQEYSCSKKSIFDDLI